MGFDTVKPIALIKSIIFHMGENNIILDFFSGSATTAHAVMQLNAEDGAVAGRDGRKERGIQSRLQEYL